MLSILKMLFNFRTGPKYNCACFLDRAAGSCLYINSPICAYPDCGMLRDYYVRKAMVTRKVIEIKVEEPRG